MVVLSGAVGSGKSTVGRAIRAETGGLVLSTRQIILERKPVDNERLSLQAAGDELDTETDFTWICDAIEQLGDGVEDEVLVVDAVRRSEQVDRLRSRFPNQVRHVHIMVDDAVLEQRHADRVQVLVEPADRADVRRNSTEAGIDGLAAGADIVFDPSRLGAPAIAAVALAGLGITRRVVAPLVDVIVGGQYGSEGKGNICSYLAERYDVLVRVGGPNAGHRVRDPDYDFVHLPSGALHNPRATLLIGAGATLSLDVLRREIFELGIGPDRLSVDHQAIIIEPEDVEWEAGSLEVIGSTKKGVGAATARKILGRGEGGGFGPKVRLARDVAELSPFVRNVGALLEEAYAADRRVMLEGTQGTDLSVHHGMWPHVTSRETTSSGCMADAGVPHDRVGRVVMVVRTYPIRVGGQSGYMGREIGAETIAKRSGMSEAEIRKTEVGTVSGKPRRIAEFDLGQIRRAAAINGATEIAITFADYLCAGNRHARRYEELSEDTREFIARVEEVTGCPVTLVACGAHRENMIERRTL
ncbi:adenylosuccinate synthetase [Sphingomonas aurantiaca]